VIQLSVSTATIRELRNHGGEVVDRAIRGETVTITRNGAPVAELRPLRPAPVPLHVLRARWRQLPAVDPVALRGDVDAVLDPSL
jgi:prevent-host-death family protein